MSLGLAAVAAGIPGWQTQPMGLQPSMEGTPESGSVWEGLPPDGDGRPGDAAAQPLDLLPFIGTGGDARVQGEAVGGRQEGLVRLKQRRARQAPQRDRCGSLVPRPR